MSDIKIEDLRRQLEIIAGKPLADNQNKKDDAFAIFLEDALKGSGEREVAGESDEKMKGITGPEIQLKDTITELEKADEAYKKMMEVRQKLVDVYQKMVKDEQKE